MKKGNDEMAKVYAADAIRAKNEAINFLRLASRIDAVAGRVATAIRMNTLNKSIISVTQGMDSILASMNVEKIATVMGKFEEQFDSLDVRSGVMEKSIASSTSTSVPEDQVDNLLTMVREKNALVLNESLAQAGSGALKAPVAAHPEAARVAEGVAAAPTAPSGTSGAGSGGAPAAGGGPSGGSNGGGGGGSGGGGDIGSSSLADRLAALRK